MTLIPLSYQLVDKRELSQFTFPGNGHEKSILALLHDGEKECTIVNAVMRECLS